MRNQIKKVAGVLAIGCIILLGSGCSKNEGKRFVNVYSQRDGITSITVWKDIETGKNYVFRKSAFAGGMCEL